MRGQPRCGRCGSTPVRVRYRVAVLAVVEGAQVTRVVVDDESIGAPEAIECPACGADEPVTGDGGVARAVDIAEAASWPGWEFGW